MSSPCPPPLASLPRPSFSALLAQCAHSPPVLPPLAGFQLLSHDDFMRALRQAPQVRMELYLPSSTDGLLARFNAILNDLPVVMRYATSVARRYQGLGPLAKILERCA